MRVLQGLLLGLAVGFAVAAALDVLPDVSKLVVAGCVLCSLVLWLFSGVRTSSASRSAAAVARVGTGQVGGVRAGGRAAEPGGMFSGRALGDALEWVAREHGLHTFYSVTVTEAEADVLGSAVPGGPLTFVVVTAGPGGWEGQLDALPAEVDLGSGGALTDDAFTAADLAPDVLSRLLDDVRRQEARPRLAGADVAAVIDRPHGLRSEVTVRVAADDDLTSATWWGSADGRLLFVDQRAEI